jgi:hypothetical protein
MMDVPFTSTAGEWENEVRAKLARGYPVDYIHRKYIPPDWENKVYPRIGGPPVWSTEDMQAYDDLRDEFTKMLKPCDIMELILTKEAVDATWESGREAREKNAVPQRQYEDRCIALAQAQRQSRVEIKPATARDHSRGLRAGFKYHQGLDVAQSRNMKRRDNALRQIERWRDNLGGKAQVLSDKFIAEQALAERYDVDQFLAYTETEAQEDAPVLVPSDEAAQIPAAPASAGEVPLQPMDATAPVASSVGASGEPAGAASPPAPAGETGEAARPVDPAGGGAAAAATRAPAGEVDWVAWLRGAQKYKWVALQQAAQKEFKQSFYSQRLMVRHLVLDRKLTRPDQVCPELAQHLAAITEAVPPRAPATAPAGEVAQPAPSVASSDEAPEAARSVALPAAAAEAAPRRATARGVEIDLDGVTERIDWITWLTGAQRYPWFWLQTAGEKAFKRSFLSKGELVRQLVLECKIIRPDQVCPAFAPWVSPLPRAARGEERK